MQTRLVLAVVAGLGLVVGGVRFAVEGSRTASSLRSIRDGSASERESAVRSLISRGVLFDGLQGGAPAATRLAAITTLKSMAANGTEPKAFDELVLLLKDPDTEGADSRTHPVRDAARTAISEVGAAYPKRIVDAAKDPDTNIRTHVREAMKKLAIPLRSEMAARLGDKDLRAPMGELLALAGPESVPLMLPWLAPDRLEINGKGDVVAAKVALIEALGRFKSVEAARAVLPFVKDSDPNVRRTSVTSLSNIAHPSTASALIGAARSSSTDGPARASAASALGAIAMDDTSAALADLLRDPDTFVATSAAVAMRRSGAVATPWVRRALQDPNPAVRRRAADAAGGLPDPWPAIDALGDPDPSVRAIAAHSLGDIAATVDSTTRSRTVATIVPFLVALLGEKDGNVATAAAEALGRMDMMAARALIPSLGATDTIAYHAANALKAMGKPVVPLVARAAGNRPTVRWAIVVLGEIGDPSARDIVRSLTDDPDPDIRFVAGAALAKLGR